jgi:hypothetical protein
MRRDILPTVAVPIQCVSSTLSEQADCSIALRPAFSSQG